MRRKFIVYIVLFLASFYLIDLIGGRLILHGIEKFYGLNQSSDILIVGHSHIMLGVNKEELEKGTCFFVSKYTREGVNLFDRYVMIKQYLESPYADSLKFILYGVDQFSFVKAGLSENSYKLFYPFMDESVMDEYVKNATDTRDYYTHKFIKLSRYSDALLNASIRGYRGDYSNYKLGTIDIDILKKKIEDGDQQFARKLEIDQELLEVFDKTVHLVCDRGIKLILINVPTVDLLKESDRIGVEKAINVFHKQANSNPLVEYWDFNPEYDSDYSIFFDPIHLNPKGQALITKEIINELLIL